MLPSDLVLLCFINLCGRGWACRSGLFCEELAQQDVAIVCIQIAVLKLFTGDAISFVYEFFYDPGVMFGLCISVPGFSPYPSAEPTYILGAKTRPHSDSPWTRGGLHIIKRVTSEAAQ